MDDAFTVADVGGIKMECLCQMLVVVDLAIDTKNNVLLDNGLCPCIDTDDSQTIMSEVYGV